MIVSKIYGGFGNQLFQFAIGLELANLNNASLVLDVSSFTDYRLRKFELASFELPAKIMIFKKLYQKENNVGLISLWPFCFFTGYVESEKKLSFDPNIKRLRKNIYLTGYWQSEHYFAHHKTQLQAIFINQKLVKAVAHNILKRIEEEESCSVHIRRGDYVNNLNTRRIHLVCQEGYFLKAMDQMRLLRPNVKFFIFSDDKLWAKSFFFNQSDVEIVDQEDGNFYDDFYLMNKCKHSIISNSTFSWWATWLRRNEGLVIAPNRWFNDDIMNQIEIVPDRWIKIAP